MRGDDSIEVFGSPDMTLEVVSPTSVEKDTVDLRRLYWEAGVKEYWLVDSREKTFAFDILRRGPAKFLATTQHQGWIKSQVFGREFKLTREMAKLACRSLRWSAMIGGQTLRSPGEVFYEVSQISVTMNSWRLRKPKT